MSDPFADFAGMTLGSDGKYAQPGVGGGQPGVQPPVAPMLAKDDPWGLVYQQQNGGAAAPAPAPAAEPAPINIMATPASAPTPVMNAPPMGAPGGHAPTVNNAAPMAAPPMAAQPAPTPVAMNNALVPSQTPSPGVMAGIAQPQQPGPGAMVVAPPPPSSDAGLPPGWTAYNDPSSGKEYYSNAATGQVTWDKPAPVAVVTAPAAALPPAAAPPAADPFGAPAPAPAAAGDPFSVFGGGAVAVTTDIVPSAAPAGDDPFGVFGGAIPAPVAAQTEAPPPAPYDVPLSPAKSDVSEMTADPAGGVPENLPHEEDDFWAQMGFEQDKPKDPSPEKPKPASADDDKRAQMKSRKSYVRHSIINIPNQAAAAVADDNAGQEDRIDMDGLPPGKTYSVELDRNTFKLGAIFMTAWQLQPTLYGKVSDKVVKALGQRPVIAYLSLAGAVNKANIEIGEILLKVNGKDATDPKQARDLVQGQEHPLTLTMHRPSLPIMLAENQHMVKYDNSKARAPSHLQGWKAKYVVVGGLGAKPWALLMYYSKFDYDRAIAANLAKRPVGHEIKIKAFDLRGCKLVENQQVSYPETHSTWHFFMIVPPTESRDGPFFPNVIKISHPEPEGLIPVLEAVKRVLKKYPTRPEKQHVTVARAQPRNVTMY